MKITANEKVITENGHLADTFFTRLKGLMGVAYLELDYCLILTPCSSIHMGFMKIPLDIAYLDQTGVVLDIQESLRPWSVGKKVKGAVAILEAPIGGVVNKLKIGDCIKW